MTLYVLTVLDASFGGFEEGHGIDGDIDDVFDDDLIGVGDDGGRL